jgi:hypothetical protein
MTKKQRKSSRQRCKNRLGGNSTFKTPTWIQGKKVDDPPKPMNRLAKRSARAQLKGWHGSLVKKEQRTIRKARLKKRSRALRKIRRETKLAMQARAPK